MINLMLILCSPLLMCATASQSPPALEDVYQSQQVQQQQQQLEDEQQPDDDQYTQPYNPYIKITYVGANGVQNVNQGNFLINFQTGLKPNITLFGLKNDILYTLLMLDVDNPSRPNPFLSPVVHYLVGNIPPPHVSQGDIVYDYWPPAAATFSGDHRITFCVYPQASQITFQESSSPNPFVQVPERLNFNVQYFLQKYNLGKCVAFNYFRLVNDATPGFRLDS